MTEKPSFLLGIDAGTSVVKAALFYPSGREYKAVARRTTLKSPRPTWAETSMTETWEMTISAIRELLAISSVSSEQIAAIGVTGNMVGAWLIDKAGQPVRDAILWCDGRSQPLIDRLSTQQPDFMALIFEASGSVMQQGCTLPVMRWLAENEPESLDRAAYVLCCKDWLIFKLTGSIQIDPTEASVMPGDTRKRGYSAAMFDLLGVSEYRHLFPPIQPSAAVICTVHAAAAQQTGLKTGIPVVAGAGDVPASALGVGAFDPGAACSLLGTNFLNCLVSSQPTFEPREVGVLFCLPGERWLRATVNVSGTTSLDWAIEQFAQKEKAEAASTEQLFSQIENLARQSVPGSRGVIYLPYLSTQGIIAPIVEPAARADFFGLANDHTRADLIRAVYEGLALSIRDGYDVIPANITDIRLSGGASKSSFFCQMIADVTGKCILVPSGNEFGAKGAALLAAVGIGWFDSITNALAADTTSVTVYEPDASVHTFYETAVVPTYVELRETLRLVWQRHRQRHAAL